jgi:hypothetical protein
MGRFDPSEREKQLVFSSLPATKEDHVEIIKADTDMTAQYARSWIRNMRRLSFNYMSDGLLRKV